MNILTKSAIAVILTGGLIFIYLKISSRWDDPVMAAIEDCKKESGAASVGPGTIPSEEIRQKMRKCMQSKNVRINSDQPRKTPPDHATAQAAAIACLEENGLHHPEKSPRPPTPEQAAKMRLCMEKKGMRAQKRPGESRRIHHQEAFDACLLATGLKKPGETPKQPTDAEKEKMTACLIGRGIKVQNRN
ncbi:MAG TPA: hypothetical protein VNJ01_11935 [Bacteriovoracaceae bacterium]|nr:hypothetical protein [Bacteriovoracaceae bacterium]